MKINDTLKGNAGIPAATTPATNARMSDTAAATATTAAATDTVRLSSQGQALAATGSANQVFDSKKVERIKAAIADGQFQVNSEKVADGLLETVRDLLHSDNDNEHMAIASPGATLREEQQLITSIVDVMKQEQELLVSADADGLASLTPEKLKLAQQLGELSHSRHKALGSAGFAASEAGMEPWLAVGGNGNVRGEWDRLLDLTRQAKELNRVNGMLLNKQLANTTGVLNALRGNTNGGGTGGVYGASGQTLAAGPSRRFVVG